MKIRKMDQTQLGNKNTSLQKDNYWEHKQRARQANPVGLIEYTNYHSLPNRTSLTETLDQLQGKAKKKASFLIVLKIILRLLVELVFQFSVFVFVKQNAINRNESQTETWQIVRRKNITKFTRCDSNQSRKVSSLNSFLDNITTSDQYLWHNQKFQGKIVKWIWIY